MVLNEEDKRKIKDFILDKLTIDPTELILQEDRDEALKYAQFVMKQRMLKALTKMCDKVR